MTRQLFVDTRAGGYGHGCDGGGGGWPGLRQVLLVRTTRELAEAEGPARPPEHHYYLTSIRPGRYTAQEMLALVRAHWLIENELHHVKDRTMHEDAQRHRPGACAAARLRSLAVGLMHCVPGKSVTAKRALLQARPALAVRLLKRKRIKRNRL